MKSEKDVHDASERAVAIAQATIENGLTGELLRHAIQSHLPSHWKISERAVVLRDHGARERNEQRAVVFANAISPTLTSVPAGAKVSVDLTKPIDLLAIAAELAAAIEKQITVREAEVRRCSVLRFALEAGAREPTRGSEGASGYDLYAPIGVYMAPGQIAVVHTGVRIELPPGYEAQVRGRSSMSKRGLWVATGTVDSDYRGVCGATITNVASTAQKIEAGDRIAQLVIARVEHPTWLQVDAAELGRTDRGDGGFGSTGR